MVTQEGLAYMHFLIETCCMRQKNLNELGCPLIKFEHFSELKVAAAATLDYPFAMPAWFKELYKMRMPNFTLVKIEVTSVQNLPNFY